MKALYLVPVLLVALGIYGYINPEPFLPASHAIKETYTDLMYSRTIQINGLYAIRKSAIDYSLPKERSNLWWNFNKSSIEAELMQNAAVQSASVTNCDDSIVNLRCFDVKVVERKPVVLAPFGTQFLIMSEDGATIYSLPLERMEENLSKVIDQKNTQLKIFNGLFGEDGSADIAKARFHYVWSTVSEIERRLKLTVLRADLAASGEIRIKTGQYPFEIVFDMTQSNTDRLIGEIHNLQMLLPEIEGRKDEILEVDLAFDKLAVVKFKDK